MAARSKARKRALDVLYEAELRGSSPVDTVRERLAQADPPVPEYAVELVCGVVEHAAAIDEQLSAYSVDWPLDRMPPVDRNILRLGAFELLYAPDVPPAVAIDEAVSLARSLSADSTPAFVNGVLGQLHRSRPAPTA